MSRLTIGQVAERTGFSASSLRYYETLGLVVPAGRSDAGYRLYDEATVDRLAFVARAKRLGCTLEEIADLVTIRDGERCGPVQRRFHDLVTAKIGETEQRLAELTRLAGELRTAAAALGAEPVDGPCGPGCACLGDPATGTVAEAAVSVALLAAPPAGADDVPIACTLPAGAVGEREREWAELLVHVSRRSTTSDGALRLALAPTAPLEDLVRLVAAEQRCCAFFAFTVTVDADGVTLDVRAPEGAEPVVAALFGAAA